MAEHVNEHAGLLTAILAGEADVAAEVARAPVAGFEVAARAVI